MSERFSPQQCRQMLADTREDPEYFLQLVDTFCSPTLGREARASMEAWGIVPDEGTGYGFARGREDHWDRPIHGRKQVPPLQSRHKGFYPPRPRNRVQESTT